MNTHELHFASDHPAGVGHFPGNPIIPGALLLAETVRLIEQAQSVQAGGCRIKSAKFLHPVRPGDTVTVEFSLERQELRFQCTVDGTKVMTGVMDVPG